MLEDEVMAPEFSEEPEEPEAPRSARGGLLGRRWVRDYLPIVVLLLIIAWLCKVFYQPGHDWGDDFALYIHQAKALVNGNVGEVVANNRYAVDNSGWNSFSPLVYPWGFPILLAPIVAVWGVNYAKLKLLVIASFLGYLFCLYRLILRRTGPIPAALIVALLGSSVMYVGWTASVLSDYPYLFFATLTLLWIDRCRLRNLLEGDGIRDLIILGLLIAYSFSMRREGLALVAALFAVQAVAIGPRLYRQARWSLGLTSGVPERDESERSESDPPDLAPAPIRWSRIAIPYTSFLGAVIALQLMLPSVLLPHFTGTGTQQIKPNIIWFRDILAEQLGLKDTGVPKLALFHSWRLAAGGLAIFVAFALLGMIARLLTAIKDDAAIVAYLLGIGYIIGTAPFHEGRYLFGITPLLAYFAYQALPTLARWARWLVPPAKIVSALLLAGLVIANITDMKPAVDYHRVYNGVMNGPTAPAALEMEQTVLKCTRGDDVVAFFRARAMSMLTDRKSIQSGDINLIMQRADWYMMNVGSTYSQPLVTDADAWKLGLRKVWGNAEWVLWLVPGGAADGRRLPC